MNSKRLVIVTILGLLLSGQAAAADRKGLDHYFKKPQYAGFQLSPNGKELAGLAPIGDRMNIA